MFGIGVGPSLLIAAVVGVEVFDVPVVFMAPIVAVLMCVVAYAVSREINTVRLGVAMVMFATAKPLLKFLTAQSGGELPEWLQATASALSSDGVVIAASVFVFVLAMIWGVFGPLRHLKSVDELLKEHEGK